MMLTGVPLSPGAASGRASFRFTHRELSSTVIVVGAGAVPESLPAPTAWVLVERTLPGWLPPRQRPAVGGVDSGLIVEGDLLRVDGEAGTVVVEGVAETAVVTAFLERPDGTVLLLRRSEKVGSFQGLWAAVSGFLEDPTAEQQALREIEEETGIVRSVIRLGQAGNQLRVRAGPRCYVVHPFRFEVGWPMVRLDWEHTEARWVDPGELDRLPCVPRLLEAWRSVARVDPASAR